MATSLAAGACKVAWKGHEEMEMVRSFRLATGCNKPGGGWLRNGDG